MQIRPLPFTLAAALLAAAGQSTALASVITWNNAAGGSASTAANWNPNQAPTAADDLTFSLIAAYPVTFGATAAASRTMTFHEGTVTLTMTTAHTTSNGVTIGSSLGDNPVAALTTGAWNSTASVIIGNAIGAVGTLNINDDDADLNITGPTADLIVGNSGSGTLNITGGGVARIADQLTAGSNSTGGASITVSGFVPTIPFPNSQLIVQGASQSRIGQGGDATVSILNGALADFAGSLVIANGSTSTSTVTLEGPGLLFGATLDVAGDLLIGRNSSAGSSAGNATVNVNDDGRLLVGGTLFLAGDVDGGVGLLHTQGASLVRAQSIAVGVGATLDLDDGAVDIDGGTFTWTVPLTPAAINGSPNNPVVTLINGATASFIRLDPTGRVLTVGGGAGANVATFDVRSGSDLLLSDGVTTLGSGADDTGGMTVSGAGSTVTLDDGSAMVVGDDGNGVLIGELGALVAGDSLFVGASAGASGAALFQNPGTIADFNQIYIGGSVTTPGGAGALNIISGASLTMTDAAPVIRVFAGSEIKVAGGSINAPEAPADIRGTLELQSGAVVDTATIVMSPASSIIAHPLTPGTATADGRVILHGGSSITLVNGDLVIGDAASPAGFAAALGSTISVDNHAITIHDADDAQIATVTIAGGSISAPNGFELLTNATFDGFGAINGDLYFASGGSVITATSTGIIMNGLLRNDSGMIDGTRYIFNQNPSGAPGGWTGAGTINARVVFNSGTQVNALANMTMGSNATDGVTFNAGSELHADTRHVTLIDSSGIGLPSITDMDTFGRVTCTQNLTANLGRRVSGRGTVQTPLLTILGTLAPGELTSVALGETGTLTVDGALTLGATANTDIQIGGITPPFQFDRVLATGPVTLGGTLNASFILSFPPAAVFEIEIISAPSISGSFAALNLPPGCRLVQSATSVTLTRCPADFNVSGALTVQDIFDFLAAYFAGATAADFNHSGAITVQDIFDFLAAYFAGC